MIDEDIHDSNLLASLAVRDRPSFSPEPSGTSTLPVLHSKLKDSLRNGTDSADNEIDVKLDHLGTSSPQSDMHDFVSAPQVASFFSPATWTAEIPGSNMHSPPHSSDEDELVVMGLIANDRATPQFHPPVQLADATLDPSLPGGPSSGPRNTRTAEVVLDELTRPLSPMSDLTNESSLGMECYDSMPSTQSNRPQKRRRLPALKLRLSQEYTHTAQPKHDIRPQKLKRLRGRSTSVRWPKKQKGKTFFQQLIQCDKCSCWYHYGCAGITYNDTRLSSSEIYVCPVCAELGKNSIHGKATCTRPDCGQTSDQVGEFIVSHIIGRKLQYREGKAIKFLYLVRWEGYSVAEATWEGKSSMADPQRLIGEFEAACIREGLSLDSPEPILLREAVKSGWKAVVTITDPIWYTAAASTGTAG
ncbi:hypothetical protein AX17_002524 [Amanita inopinata Kibby_2008]|nr:hypothetical protein AX17_002524 [Amanita inopinata Kibby_2008]